MDQCYSPKLFPASGNQSADQLGLVQSLRAFKQAYEPIHGYLCLPICGFGVITNVIHIFVLTSKNMRNSAVNVILTAIAFCDAGTMLSYLVYLVHFVLGPKDYCGTFMSWGWMCFLMIHISVSIALHTSSLWLAVGMAFLRLMTLRQGSLSSRWQKSEAAWKISLGVYATVILLCVPTIAAHQILEFDRDTWHGLCRPNISRSVYYEKNSTVYYDIFTIGMSQLALRDDCVLYKANLWLTGVMFKVIPCAFLVFLSWSLLVRISDAEKNRRRLLGTKNINSNNNNASKYSVNDRTSPRSIFGGGNKKQTGGGRHRRTGGVDHTTVMLITILLVCLLTELPQGFIAILNAIYLRDVTTYIYQSLDDFMDLLSLVNASVNFVLYCVMSSRYRQTFWKVVLPRKAYLLLFIRRKLKSSSAGTTMATNLPQAGTDRFAGVTQPSTGYHRTSVTGIGVGVTEAAKAHYSEYYPRTVSGTTFLSPFQPAQHGNHHVRRDPGDPESHTTKQQSSNNNIVQNDDRNYDRIAYLTDRNPSLFPKQNATNFHINQPSPSAASPFIVADETWAHAFNEDSSKTFRPTAAVKPPTIEAGDNRQKIMELELTSYAATTAAAQSPHNAAQTPLCSPKPPYGQGLTRISSKSSKWPRQRFRLTNNSKQNVALKRRSLPSRISKSNSINQAHPLSSSLHSTGHFALPPKNQARNLNQDRRKSPPVTPDFQPAEAAQNQSGHSISCSSINTTSSITNNSERILLQDNTEGIKPLSSDNVCVHSEDSDDSDMTIIISKEYFLDHRGGTSNDWIMVENKNDYDAGNRTARIHEKTLSINPISLDHHQIDEHFRGHQEGFDENEEEVIML